MVYVFVCAFVYLCVFGARGGIFKKVGFLSFQEKQTDQPHTFPAICQKMSNDAVKRLAKHCRFVL